MPKLKTTITLPRADMTRMKIIRAARTLFSQNGFAGTSIGKIATKAKINHSLIFHHFENKEGLWKAVKANITQDATKKAPIIPNLTLSFDLFLKKLITQTIAFYQNNPDIVRMISWQRLEYANKKDIGVTLSKDAQSWLDAFKHYQKQGDIANDIKIEFVLTLTLSIISSVAMDPNVFVKKDKDLNDYITFIVRGLITMLNNSVAKKIIRQWN